MLGKLGRLFMVCRDCRSEVDITNWATEHLGLAVDSVARGGRDPHYCLTEFNSGL